MHIESHRYIREYSQSFNYTYIYTCTYKFFQSGLSKSCTVFRFTSEQSVFQYKRKFIYCMYVDDIGGRMLPR